MPGGLRLSGVPRGTDGWIDAFDAFEEPYDSDFFKITVDTTGQLLVHTSNSSLRGSGTLRDTQGNHLVTAQKLGGARFSMARLVSAGTYYLEVKGYNHGEDHGFEGGPYTLHTRFIPDDDNGATRATATEISLPSDNDAAGFATLLAHDADYFKVVVPDPEDGEVSGRELTVYTSGGTDPIGFLQDANGTELARNASSSSLPGFNFKLSRIVDPGTYYVLVRDRPGFYGSHEALVHSDLGPYGLHARFVSNDGHGNTMETATVIELPSETDATLMSSDVDYFKFTVDTFGELTLYTSGNSGIVRWLLDSDGNYLAAVGDDPTSQPSPGASRNVLRADHQPACAGVR